LLIIKVFLLSISESRPIVAHSFFLIQDQWTLSAFAIHVASICTKPGM